MIGTGLKTIGALAALALCAAACEDKVAPPAADPAAKPKAAPAPATPADEPKAADQAKDQAFWSWFKANAKRIHAFEQDQQVVFKDLGEQLKKVSPSLGFEFGPVTDGVREFTVSANGIHTNIPAVQRLVAAAGQVEGFKVQAFRQRKSAELEVEFQGKKLSPKSVYFAHRPGAEGKVDILLHIEGLTPASTKTIAEPAFLLLDVVIGEYDVMTRIGSIAFAPLPADPAKQDLKPLKDLAALVDAAKK